MVIKRCKICGNKCNDLTLTKCPVCNGELAEIEIEDKEENRIEDMIEVSNNKNNNGAIGALIVISIVFMILSALSLNIFVFVLSFLLFIYLKKRYQGDNESIDRKLRAGSSIASMGILFIILSTIIFAVLIIWLIYIIGSSCQGTAMILWELLGYL